MSTYTPHISAELLSNIIFGVTMFCIGIGAHRAAPSKHRRLGPSLTYLPHLMRHLTDAVAQRHGEDVAALLEHQMLE
ncbi:hypothetical protein LTR67_004219 [Exophiala xenobiotica]